MRIYIPTARRGPARQHTVFSLGPELVEKYRVTLVVPPNEADAMELDPRLHGAEVFACEAQARGIGTTRQAILDQADDDPHVLMLDDDLTGWAWRPDPEVGKYVSASKEQIAAGLALVDDLLHVYGHGGIGPRQLANQRSRIDYNCRQFRALAYDRDVLREAGVKFRLPVMEDFDVALQLLRRGHHSFQVNQLVQDQLAANLDGGCSTYRTAEVQREAARRLAALHPGLVKVVTVTPKHGVGMWAERTDVRISWKKALETPPDLDRDELI